MKYFILGNFYTELGREIAMNDLRNIMRKLYCELLSMKKQKDMAKKYNKPYPSDL